MEPYVVTLRKVCILMNINTISYWFVEAISSIIKNKKIFLSGVAVMTVALFLISIFFISYSISGSLMDIVEDSLGKIDVFLEDMDEEQTESIKNAIMLLDHVESIEYISKEEAFEKAKSVSPVMTTGVQGNIYPASFIITIDDLEAADQIVLAVRGIHGVGEKEEDVKVHDGLDKVNKVASTVRVLALTVFILTAVSSCFIMMNSIKLMLYSRRREISIMKYVGATDLFTKAPFVIEGLIIALVSAMIVMIISSFICNGLAGVATNISMFAFLTNAKEMMHSISIILLLLAVSIGTIGSSMSINKYLDV